MYNEIYYLNEDQGTDNMVQATNKSVQGKVSAASKLEQDYIDQYLREYVFHIDLQNDLYGTIQFPTLPTNFQMLMSKMDFPQKAMENPNDALFMDPKKIDATEADDLGKQLFNSKSFKNLTGLKTTLNPGAYTRQFEELGYIVDELTARYITEDTPSGTGVTIKPADTKSINQQMTKMSQDVINAITTYIRRSMDVVKPMLEMVAGGSAVKDVMRALNTANSTQLDTVKGWLDNVNRVKKDYNDSLKALDMARMRTMRDALSDGYTFFGCVNMSDMPSGVDKKKYMSGLIDEIKSAKNRAKLDSIVRRYCKDFNNWTKFDEELDKQGGPFKLTLKDPNATHEALDTVTTGHLNEYDDALDAAEATTKVDSTDLNINYDSLYFDMVNHLSGEIANVVGERENWLCFKNIREKMKNLKDRADEEIKKKIEIVCKTGGQKSLIKWPFKAEGLLTMWNRYSSELDIRMDNRIAQLTGSSGSVETGSANMMEDFLKSTYPQIVAALLTYRTLFEQLNVFYKNDYAGDYTLEDREAIKQEMKEEFGDRIKTLAEKFRWRTV